VMMAVLIPDDFGAQVDAGAEVMAHASLGPESVARVDEALALLEQGFPL
jgi:hypothetical protein